MACYICGSDGKGRTMEYDGYDRRICDKCVSENPSVFDSCNTNVPQTVLRFTSEDGEVVDSSSPNLLELFDVWCGAPQGSSSEAQAWETLCETAGDLLLTEGDSVVEVDAL